MSDIDLIQPRHNCAPSFEESRLGHVYMPTSLLTAAARLLACNVNVKIHDENITPFVPTSNIIGMNLLGAPYIPVAINTQHALDKEAASRTYILGGQVVNGLLPYQFRRLFGSQAINGNNDKELAHALGIKKDLPLPEKTSLISAYRLISDDHMQKYLSGEFGLYVSQGCKFACDFCAAARTFRDPVTGIMKKVQEIYRDAEMMHADMQYLIQKARQFYIQSIQFYMSNLDVFQTQSALHQFAQVVQSVRRQNSGYAVNFRGLATVESFLQARKSAPQTIESLVDAGFNTVGFGVDGMTPQVWRAVNKGMNTKDKCLEAIRSARKDFGITPEILMVFGHAGIDTPETLELAYEFTLDMVEKYGAVPRPHIAKNFIPGNNGWVSGHEKEIDILLQHPESFAALDFTALPSRLTHPGDELRKLASIYYRKICEIPGNTTLYLEPITPDMTPEQVHAARLFNKRRYDR